MNSQLPPLRILQVNSLFSGGGTDNQTIELAAGLRDRGEDVTLAIAAGSRWETRARELSGVRVEAFDPKSPLKLAMICTLVRLIRAERIQIIHAHQGRDYWPAIIAARLAGHGTRPVVTRHLITRPRALSRALLLRVSDVIAVSRAVHAVLERELRGPRRRLHQIYGGIDVRAFQTERTTAAEVFRRQQGWADDTVVLGVLGSHHWPRGKGQLEFLEAAAKLKTNHPQARYVIVGKGEMGSLLRKRITELQLGNVATVAPFTDDIATVINALDVLVHPALGTEALGLVLWEAMSCAKPVIASRLDGITEAFIESEHGLLVPPGDVAALADAMGALLKNPERRARFGQAGRAHVMAHFTRRHLAENTVRLYQELTHRDD